MKYRITKSILAFALALGILFLTGCSFTSPFKESDALDNTVIVREEEGSTVPKETSGEIYVHVCGCVRKPGVYRLADGARVQQAIEQAGGFTKKADRVAWNLAEPLQDGVQIYVPSLEESKKGEQKETETNQNASAKEGKININQASKEELMTLSGIGASRADAIIACREEKGSFASIEEIKDVDGIGDGIFRKIKDLITVN